MSNQLVKNYNYMGNFYNANKTFCNAINGTFTEPQKSKYFFNEHLSDNNDIEKELFENLKKPMQKTFVSAPTGSGKTYTLVKDIFPRLQEESNGTCINLIFVPNRSQAEQMAQEYDSIVSIVGDEKRYRAIDTEHSGDYAVVYDKAEDVKLYIEKMITSGIDVHVHMVIDECHTLTSARFREQALKNMFELEEFVTKEKGSVMYITATAEAMSWIRVNQYLFFDYCKPHQKFQQLNLFTENQLNRTFKDFLLDCVLPHKGILRLNSKRMQQQLVTTLSHAGYQVYKVDGDDKAYDVDEDGHIIYQNEFLNTVINQSAIINSDLTLCTSILDAGQNITGICRDGTKVQDPNYCGYYCILTINDLDFNNILQFANRIRYDTQSFNIVYFNKDIYNLNRNDQLKKFKTLEELTTYICYYLKRDVERLTKEAELRKQYAIADGTYNEKVFEKKQNYDLQFTDSVTGRSDSYGGALEYKDGQYIIHENFLCCYILDVYYKQFFYHFDLFVEKLEVTFGMKVNHIDNVASVNIVNPEMDKETKEELLSLVQNTDFLNHYMKDVYAEIRKTPVFDELYYLKELGLPFKDAIEKVCTLSERQLTQLTNELTQKYMSQLDSYQLELLEDILTRKKLFNDLKGYNKDVIGKVLRNENYIEKLKKMLKIGIPLKTSIRIPVKDISKRIREYQIIENNKKYLQNPSDLLTTARQTQYWILHYIETELHFDMKSKNRILMNDDRVKQICKLIETNTKVSYKPKQVWNMIMMMFRVWCTQKNGQSQIQLCELNTIFVPF